MKKLTNTLTGFAALLPLLIFSNTTNAADAPREPLAVLNSLNDRIYVLGETGGNPTAMIDAEAKAADEIRQYIATGATAGLLADGKDEDSPLVSAAYLGYPNVVTALLTSSIIKKHINDADRSGLTPWIAANFSIQQTMWVCNPEIFDIPTKFVPMVVSQPYYASNPTPPYKEVRNVLEKSGASPDLAKAKLLWITHCTRLASEAKAKVQASADLQKTLQELGAADFLTKLSTIEKESGR
ncbi:hypothetical protein [Solimicrobium silvestre]|uniref:Uncharacterized protein n=1 Tax=Solimicrobium silvestre TaxID=2099400 RepID=A0A2S9H445_9BURK|nr:hypothetical protein [Solimicrobium silvestre]PRC94747.1 hypothetical protein S2091_0750 [Solimicrobium silvestre]